MRSRRSHRTTCALLLVVLAVLPSLAAAFAPLQPRRPLQPPSIASSASPPAPAIVAGHAPGTFPEPLAWAWALVAACGALGALAGHLVAGEGRLDPRSARLTGMLRFAGEMTVGAVTALLVLSLHPPDGSWLKLVGTALGSGVGGEAVLLAILSSRRAQGAEKNLAAVEAQAALGATLAIEKIETFRALSLAARRGSVPHQDGQTSSEAEIAEFDRIINTYAERAKSEIAASA